ncbi:C-type lectin domain family 2 member E, partial [Acanthisitta chloris]
WLGFQGKCYYFSEVEANWTTSQGNCRALGPSLAILSIMDEPGFTVCYKGEANLWLGLEKRHDRWFWSMAQPLTPAQAPCANLNQGWISSSLCHSHQNWVCSHPHSYVLWRGK